MSATNHTFRRVVRAARLASEGVHPYASNIPRERLQAALRALTEIQLKPNNFSQHKQLAWDALDALAPDIAILPAHEAWKRVRED